MMQRTISLRCPFLSVKDSPDQRSYVNPFLLRFIREGVKKSPSFGKKDVRKSRIQPSQLLRTLREKKGVWLVFRQFFGLRSFKNYLHFCRRQQTGGRPHSAL